MLVPPVLSAAAIRIPIQPEGVEYHFRPRLTLRGWKVTAEAGGPPLLHVLGQELVAGAGEVERGTFAAVLLINVPFDAGLVTGGEDLGPV